METLLHDIYARHEAGFSGAVLAKAGGRVLLSAAGGQANRDFGIPNRIDTRFDTASVTKVFTAVATLQLVSRGLLHLDEGIVDVVDLSGTQISADVRIEHLLSHTSGIADDADEEAGEAYEDLFIDKPNYSIRSCADFLPQFAYKPPVFPAGTDVRYNNCAFVLLGLAIEARTGMGYREYVAEHILAPAHLDATAFLAKDEVCPGAAEGYFPVQDEDNGPIRWKKNIYAYPPIGTPDGGIYTTVGDLAALLEALRGGLLLPAPCVDQLFAPHGDFPRPHRLGTWRAGYGFEFIERDGQIACMYKEGENPGVEAMLACFPAHDLTLCLLSNQSDGALWRLYGDLRQAILTA